MDFISISNLYDCYKTLLTVKQQQYFEDYYFHNLTLSEMGENYDISRNAIHKQLKEVETKLKDYEDKLKLFSKRQKMEQLIKKVDNVEVKKELEELI